MTRPIPSFLTKSSSGSGKSGYRSLRLPGVPTGAGFEGASGTSREMMTWNPPSMSATQEVESAKEILDARSRDAARNDGTISAAAQTRMNNAVGSRYLLNARPNYQYLGLDREWAKDFQEEVEGMFNLAATSVNCYFDVTGKMTLVDMLRLSVMEELVVGETAIKVVWDTTPGRPFRTAFQMIDSDRIMTPPRKMNEGNIVGGVQLNAYGRPEGYYIANRHPAEFYGSTDEDFTYVPAAYSWGRHQMIHSFMPRRINQIRGLSTVFAGLKDIRVLRRFRDIVLQNALINATYAATVESELPNDVVAVMMGGGDDPEKVKSAYLNYAGAMSDVLNKFMGNSKNIQVDGAKVPHLLPGTKLQLRPAGQGGPLGTDFEKSILRHIATTLSVSYEELTKDYSETNYSSAKAGTNETDKSMAALKAGHTDRIAGIMYMSWFEEMNAAGKIETMRYRKVPNFWDGMNRDAFCAAMWIGGGRGQIDELKETQAAVQRMRNGLGTSEIELGRLGLDYREVYAQLAEEKALRQELDIESETDLLADNMANATTGAPRPANPSDGDNDDEE